MFSSDRRNSGSQITGMILSLRGSLVAQLNAIAIHGDVYGYFGHAQTYGQKYFRMHLSCTLSGCFVTSATSFGRSILMIMA